jgi:hypothetical protein
VFLEENPVSVYSVTFPCFFHWRFNYYE